MELTKPHEVLSFATVVIVNLAVRTEEYLLDHFRCVEIRRRNSETVFQSNCGKQCARPQFLNRKVVADCP